MTEKVKVSREVASNLKELKDIHGVEKALRMHSDFLKVPEPGWGGNWDVFNRYNLTDFARMLIGDFEIEQTPEEKALAYFNKFDETPLGEATEKSAIRKFLQLAEIKIKGINE